MAAESEWMWTQSMCEFAWMIGEADVRWRVWLCAAKAKRVVHGKRLCLSWFSQKINVPTAVALGILHGLASTDVVYNRMCVCVCVCVCAYVFEPAPVITICR